MKTTITKVFLVDEPIQKVWENLSAPSKIVTCVPGAAITEEIDERNFKGEVTMKFGPIKAQYAGDIAITELDHEGYNMMLKGKGIDSKGKGTADMLMNGKLTEKDGNIEVRFEMEVTIIGKLAQFGARLITDVSNQVLNQFVENFKSKLAGEEFNTEMSAGSLVGSVVKSKLGGFLGGNKEKDA